MAHYRFERFLRISNDGLFDKTVPAGSPAQRSGIYRCDGCGHEVTVIAPSALPGEDHHTHTSQQKLVRWKLIVADGGKGEDAPRPQYSAGATSEKKGK